MRAVILAAGDGGRLGPHTSALPKPLVPLNGRPLVDYTLAALAAAGVRDATVVTGYRENQVVEALSAADHPGVRLTFVSNPHYHGDASLSLRAARDTCGAEPFLLLMSDHVASAELVAGLLAAHRDAAGRAVSFVAADRSAHEPEYTDEATKLALAPDGAVTAIGKQLARWDALDAGAFVVHPSAWEAVDAVAEDCELSVIFTELARRRSLFAADVSGAFWYDVDTAADLEAAGQLLRGLAPEPV